MLQLDELNPMGGWEHAAASANLLGYGHPDQLSSPHGKPFFQPLDCEPTLQIGYVKKCIYKKTKNACKKEKTS
jgi:hypothetical protein